MKIRFGALALVAALAACSGPDQSVTGDSDRGGQVTAAPAGAGSAIAGYAKDSQRTLGNAPDRGELLTYKKDAAVLHKGAYTLRPIALSEEHAIRGVATGMMTIPAPDGSKIKIRYQRHEESPDGNWSWVGRVVGGDQTREAIITFGEHAVFGSIPQANGPSLQLTTERGIAYLVQADAARLFRGTRAGGDAKVPAAYGASSVHETESLVASATQKIQAQALAASPKAVPAANTVDLVAGYSNGLATRLGGASAAVTKLTNLVAAANAALLNSNVNGKIRLVYALQVSYADNTDNGTALDELTGNNGTGPVTVPSGLAPLRAARETYGADLVTLVRDFKSENNGCGIAWLIGANQQPITIAGDAPFAYSVVSEGSYQSGTSTFYCEDITLAHEMAHNMGSAHDAANAPDPGRYPYSYGYKTTAAAGNFFTVMAYGDDNQTLHRVFSNPLITICGGLACGVANQADNARSLNQTVPVVATFRATVVPVDSVMLDLYVVKKNGVSKTEVRGLNRLTNYQTYIFPNTASILGKTGSDESWNFDFGKFNADAAYDMYAIKKMGASGKTEVHVVSGSGGFKTYLMNVATILGQTGTDNSWEFKVADYNQDGKPDLYAIKKQGVGGRLEIRVLNGANNFQTYLLSTATALSSIPSNYAWNFELGDFNGDGKPDLYAIKKVSGTGKTEIQILNAAGNFNSFLLSRTTLLGQTGSDNAWSFKVGDYNRDGVLDVYAIKKMGASGKTEVFVMNGANQFQSYLAIIATTLGTTGTDASWKFGLVRR